MQLEFRFIAPSRLHASGSDVQVGDLATFLESKYGLISGFTNYTKEKLLKHIEKLSHRYLSARVLTLKCLENNYNRDLSSWLQNEWRDYINREKHNIETKSAKDEDRISFINTGDYFKSIIVRIRLKK